MSDNKHQMMKSLKDRAKEFSVQLPFMEGCEKGDTKELLSTVTTINEYGFLPSDSGEMYAVFTVKECPKRFYFGGAVLTDRLLTLDAEGYHDAIAAEGLPVLMTQKKSKGGRFYTNVEFYPEG